MDLLKSMLANRASAPVIHDPKPTRKRDGRKPTKTDRAKEQTPGSRAMRTFILEEKPSKKVVKDHLEAIVQTECESSEED
jgi:hypothetical protein